MLQVSLIDPHLPDLQLLLRKRLDATRKGPGSLSCPFQARYLGRPVNRLHPRDRWPIAPFVKHNCKGLLVPAQLTCWSLPESEIRAAALREGSLIVAAPVAGLDKSYRLSETKFLTETDELGQLAALPARMSRKVFNALRSMDSFRKVVSHRFRYDIGNRLYYLHLSHQDIIRIYRINAYRIILD